MDWNEYPDSIGGKSTPRDGAVHNREPWFAMTPIEIIHDKSLTDGAVRLFSHMLWRYGQNQSNFEKRQTMADALGVSDTTITNRIKELEAAGWLVVVERGNPSEGNFTTPFYHLFTFKQDSLKFRATYTPADNETVRSKSKNKERKSRKGVGGNPKLHLPKATASTQVEPLERVNSSSPVPVNSSSRNLDTVYLDTIKDSLPTGDAQSSADAIEQTTTPVDTTTPNKERPRDLMWDIIAKEWTLPPSRIGNMKKFFLAGFVEGKDKAWNKKHAAWIKHNIDYPMSPEELGGFVKWYRQRNPNISLPESPESLSTWTYRYRESLKTKTTPTQQSSFVDMRELIGGGK